MRWQRITRLIIAVVGVAFAVGVGSTMKRRSTPQTAAPVPRSDPTAVAESEGGSTLRIKGDHEDGVLKYKRLLTYASGASKMLGVTITSDRNGKTFVVTGAEGQAGENESAMALSGGVRMESSDGMVVTADRAEYSRAENIIRAPGPVTFSRGRMAGTGVGMEYNQGEDVIKIADRVAVNVDADADGAGAMSLASGSMEFRRVEKTITLDRGASITRGVQTITADLAVAHLSADEQRLERLELRTNARIAAASSAAGGLESLTGRDIDLRYGGDGQSLEHAVLRGNAVMRLAGEKRNRGRQIAADTIDIGLAPDGVTPTALVARNDVKVSMPGDPGSPCRNIEAEALDSKGDDRLGLTGAHFSGNVRFSERKDGVDREARSAALDVAMAPGFGAIEEAAFSRGVRFDDGPLFATSAAARYDISRGVLELTGTEPGSLSPHVVTDQIAIDGTRIDITLDGPMMKATGAVKSVLQPKKAGAPAGATPARLPSMLKAGQAVNVTADELLYDGTLSRAVYTGTALLWQGDTSVKGSGITIDSQSGDLSASGPVTTSTMLQQDDHKGGKEKVHSVGTSKEFAYLDSAHRATYTGDAHITGPQGDLTSPKVELYLQPSGDELERAESYDGVTLRGDGRKTTGQRLTFFGADQRYLVTGSPVTIVDECGRETTGRSLTFFRATDRMVVDGSEQIRTQTRGKSTCR